MCVDAFGTKDESICACHVAITRLGPRCPSRTYPDVSGNLGDEQRLVQETHCGQPAVDERECGTVASGPPLLLAPRAALFRDARVTAAVRKCEEPDLRPQVSVSSPDIQAGICRVAYILENCTHAIEQSQPQLAIFVVRCCLCDQLEAVNVS